MTQRRGLGKGLGALIPAGGVKVASVPGPARVAHDDAAAENHEVVDIREPVQARVGGRVAPADPGLATFPHPDPGGDPVAAPQPGAASPDLPAAAPHRGADAGLDIRAANVLSYRELPVGDVRPNPRQPRQVFDEEAMAELVHSITTIGLLQPIVVRPVADGFELVAGERRLRATRLAGLDTIPALVRQTDDDVMLRDALLENLHRVQLNPLEEAAAYSQLMSDFSCTQEELARRVGRSRPQVTNTLRLLKLPVPVQRRVAAGVLSAGHARAILGAGSSEQMEDLASRVVAEGLSVRAVEELVLLTDSGDDPKPKRRSSRRTTPVEFREAADRLADRLETRVRIEPGRAKGRIIVEFAGVEDLARLLDLMGTPDGS